MATPLAFPRICVALGLDTAAELRKAAALEIEDGEQFLEFRLDYLPDPALGLEVIRDTLAASPDVVILATCRRKANAGRFVGTVDEQVRLLALALDAGCRAVDLEIESAEEAKPRLSALRGRAKLVLSYHNFENTPSLEPLMQRLLRVGGDVYKVVTTAKKPTDVYRVLSLAKAFPREQLVLLAMGEQGGPTRILSPLCGGLYSYAAARTGNGTADGQITARQLRQLYRLEKLGKSSKIYGVIAEPVRHSISPAVHNRAFGAKRLDSVYLPFLVPGAQLRDFMTLAEKLPVAGFSVTIPHKQKVLRYLDFIEPLARRIGAVNTVWRKAGKWRGANTDAAGVTGPLGKRMRLAKSTVLLVGNGGAARSAAFALSDAGAKLSITGRDTKRVRALARACGAAPLSADEAQSSYFDALIHATPLGMYPNTEECFFSGAAPSDVVFDMVYNPCETALIQRALADGKEVIYGLEMFLEQAAKQFEIWTGDTAPRALMEKAALEVLQPHLKRQALFCQHETS